MKIYRKIKKRRAKKILGKWWYKLLWGSTLKVGDLIHTCRGFNEEIKEIVPVWDYYKGRVVIDFEIETVGGDLCSLANCCGKARTKEELIKHYSWYQTAAGQTWLDEQEKLGWKFRENIVIKSFLAGKDVFDNFGKLKEESCES